MGTWTETFISETRAKLLRALRCSRVDSFPPQQYHYKQREELTAVLRRTVEHGVNESVLLVGARGTGKRTAVDAVLLELKEEQRLDFAVVRIDGNLVPDDALAVRAICEQLKVDMGVSTNRRESYSDSMRFLVETLRRNAQLQLPLLVVIDDFELFASRPKQALLYNLLDLLQSAAVQMAVVGITAKANVIEQLEKRVRSRLSNRYILFHGPQSLSELVLFLKSLLPIEKLCSDQQYIVKFNQALDATLNDDTVSEFIQRELDVGQSLNRFISILGCVIASFTSDDPFLTAESFLRFANATPSDMHTQQIVDCSEIEILLLACMCLLEDKSLTSYNFRMVYDEYENVKVASAAQQVLIPVFSKVLCLRAFESLLEKRVVLPLALQSSVTLGTAKQYSMVRLPFYYRTRELIKSTCELPLWLNRWLGREFTGK